MAKNSPCETRTSKMAYGSKSLLPSNANWTNRFQSTSCPSIGGCAVTIPHIIQFDFSDNRVNQKILRESGFTWSPGEVRELLEQIGLSPETTIAIGIKLG